jgi:hypothetical protein
MARDETTGVVIGYVRHTDVVSFKLVNVDENELRAYIVALWLVLEPTSRIDMIRELAHYHEAPDAYVPEVAHAIADAYREAAH